MRTNPGPIQRHTIFQMTPPRGYVSVHDAREAYNMAKRCTKESEKEALYESLGLDRKRVEKYLVVVESLDKTYKNSDNAGLINKIIALVKRSQAQRQAPYNDYGSFHE